MDLNEIPRSDLVVVKEELEDKKLSKCDDEKLRKCREIELLIGKKNMHLEEVKDRIRVLEGEKVAIEDEIKGLNKKKADLELEPPKVNQLMIENEVLECERSRAKKRGRKVVTSDDEHEIEEAVPRKRTFRIDNNSDDEGPDDDDDIRSVKQAISAGDLDNDNESDDEDNIPISQLKMRHANQPDNITCNRPRRRLVKSKQCRKTGRAQVTDYIEDDKSEEDGSDSDSDSLSRFIVDDNDVEELEDDDVSEKNGTDDDDDCNEPEDGSDSDIGYEDMISRLASRNIPNSKWNLEAEMLADFGKDPKLCMRAVCALYRQENEKYCEETLVSNGRGFNRYDAPRGTNLGSFLTGEDPNSDLVKSEEELQEYDPDGLNACEKLAKRYSKQLFVIYKNQEDPFFR